MSEQDKNARPSQVTMAGWVALIASVLLVFTLFEAVGQLRTVQFRDQVDEFLSTPPGSGLGLDIPQVVEIMRVLMMFSGAAAAAAMVLAIYVLQRNNGARIGFTVAAAVIMLTAPVAGGFLPVMIGFAAIMLWSRPARDWFAGRPVTQTGAFAMPRRDTVSGRPGDRRTLNDSAEGNDVSSHDHPQGQGGQSGPTGPDSGEGAPPPTWPRMPGEEEQGPRGPGDGPRDSAGRPLPPPMQGYGTPGSQQYGQQGQQGQQGQGQPGQPGQPGYPPPYPPRPGGPGYPQGAPGYPQPGGQGYPPPGYGQPGQYAYPPQGYGQPGQYAYPPQPYGYPQQYGHPQQSYGGESRRPADPDRRPATVTAAAWITWVLSSLAVLFFLMIGLVMVAARDDFLRQLERDQNFQQFDLRTDQVVAGLWGMGAVALFWGVSALALAWFAYRRANWARITLAVSSAMTVLVSLAAFPVGLLHTFGAGAVVALLFLGGANEWYSRRPTDQGFPGAFQPYGGPQASQPGSAPASYGAQQSGPAYGDPSQRPGPAYGDQPQRPGPAYGDDEEHGGQGDQPAPGAQPPPPYGEPEQPRDKKDEPPSNVW